MCRGCHLVHCVSWEQASRMAVHVAAKARVRPGENLLREVDAYLHQRCVLGTPIVAQNDDFHIPRRMSLESKPLQERALSQCKGAHFFPRPICRFCAYKDAKLLRPRFRRALFAGLKRNRIRIGLASRKHLTLNAKDDFLRKSGTSLSASPKLWCRSTHPPNALQRGRHPPARWKQQAPDRQQLLRRGLAPQKFGACD